MKNILIVTSSLFIGGSERVIANLAKYIDHDRFNVTICHLKNRGEIGEELLRQGHRVVSLPQARNAFDRYLSFIRLRHLVHENRIDLVHSHTTYSLVDSALARLTSPGVKMVHTFHRGNYPNHVKRYMRMERLFSRVPERLVAVGIEQRESIRNTYGIAPDRIVTILNGVEAAVPSVEHEWQQRLARTCRPVIGTICTLIEQKGITYLLDTARQLAQQGSDAIFVIVGDGPLRGELEEKCRRLGLGDQVFFAGWKANAASTMLPLFDVFFQPSLWEAMSMVVLEAMAAHKAVVVTDVGDNRHVVVNDATGLVVPPKDVDAMAHALGTLVGSKELCERFGEAGGRRFEQHYTARAMARRYEELYADILG